MKRRRKYKLLLINPLNQYRKGFVLNPKSTYPPIGLGIIAALTPDHWDVEILDENFEEFELKDVDLVGFTAFTAQIYRAYELSGKFRQHGIKTVIGGIHASMVPDEAMKYADSVVIGEAESTWATLISDFENNKLKKSYRGELLPMNGFPKARHDLFHPSYDFTSIQTTRGCPMKCEFCSVHRFNGSRYRQRPVEEVLDEMEIMPHNNMFIVDDNIIGYSKQSQRRAIELFKGMIKRKIGKEWFTQASLNIADNEDVLKYMSEAGCRMIFLGIESEKEAQLKEQNKGLNVKIGGDKYQEVFDKIHNAGITVLGSFIFGMDADTVEDLHARADYILNSSIDCYQTGVLTPLPGTPLFERFLKEDRMLYSNFPEDWQHYHVYEVAIRPKQMELESLREEMTKVWSKIYNKEVFTRKFINALRSTKNANSAIWSFFTNMHYHNMAFEGDQLHMAIEDILSGKPTQG